MRLNNATAVFAVAELEAVVREDAKNPVAGLKTLNRLIEWLVAYEPTLAGLSAGQLNEKAYWRDGVYVNELCARVLINYEAARRGSNCDAPPRVIVTPEGQELEQLLDEGGVYAPEAPTA